MLMTSRVMAAHAISEMFFKESVELLIVSLLVDTLEVSISLLVGVTGSSVLDSAPLSMELVSELRTSDASTAVS